MFDFSIITTWFDNLLRQTLGLGDFWSILIECVLVGLLIIVGYALLAIVLIFMERKVLCVLPVPSRPDACRSVGITSSVCRRVKDAYKRNLYRRQG